MARPPLTAPILGDPSRSAADPYDLHSDLKREEPVCSGSLASPTPQRLPSVIAERLLAGTA